MRLKFALVAAALSCALVGAVARGADAPFVAAVAQKPKVVRLLGREGLFDPHAFEAFERETGYAVAYDTYALALEIPEKWKDGPYDVVALPGPTIAKRIAAGALARLDRRRLANASALAPAIDARLAAYDRGLAFAAPLGWAPYGLIYNVDKVQARLGGAPGSWSALLDPRLARGLSGCGIAIPNARDAMFVAAWRFAGIDPARARPLDIRQAAALIARARPAMQAFALADPVGAMSRGTICLTVGTPGEAEAANARAKTIGAGVEIGFAEPKEGAGVEIEALAVPRDAPSPDIAYRLIDFLLDPGVATANARVSGLSPSVIAPDPDLFKRLWPLGAFDDSFAQALETEWTRLRTSK